MQNIDQLLKILTSPNSASVVDELLKTLNEANKGRKQPRERDVGGREWAGGQDSWD